MAPLGRALIVSHDGDVHASAVEWAANPGTVTWWRGSKILGHDFLSLEFEQCGLPSIETTNARQSLQLEGRWRSVWFRRPPIAIPPTDIRESDKGVARREGTRLLSGISHLLDPLANWINPIDNIAGHKPIQLLTARSVGFDIPPTLMSNDPRKIRNFFERYRGDVIYKSFYPAAWQDEHGKNFTVYATLLTSDILKDDLALSACPGIFQKRINRKSEYRVTVMGRTCLAARVTPSLDSESDQIDIKTHHNDVIVSRAELPSAVQDKCIGLTRALGVRFGCIDIVQDLEGRYIFLEINPQGQFLWLEDINPNLPMLDAFSDFLMDGSQDFEWRGPSLSRDRSMASYRQSEAYTILRDQYDPLHLLETYKVSFRE